MRLNGGLLSEGTSEYLRQIKDERQEQNKRESTDLPRVAPCVAHAYSSEEQEEIQQKKETLQKRFGEINYKTKVMTTEEKDWFLSLPKETKLMLMDDMLKEDKTGMAFETMNILLEAPISKGGISSDEIKVIFDNDIERRKASK